MKQKAKAVILLFASIISLTFIYSRAAYQNKSVSGPKTQVSDDKIDLSSKIKNHFETILNSPESDALIPLLSRPAVVLGITDERIILFLKNEIKYGGPVAPGSFSFDTRGRDRALLAKAIANKGSSSLPQLTAMLQDESQEDIALYGFAYLGAEALPAVGQIIPFIEEKGTNVFTSIKAPTHEIASKTLTKIGPVSIDRLLESASHGEPFLKERAIRIIDAMEIKDKERKKYLEGFLSDRDKDVQVVALGLLLKRNIDTELNIQKLIKMLDTDDLKIRLRALSALNQTKSLPSSILPACLNTLQINTSGKPKFSNEHSLIRLTAQVITKIESTQAKEALPALEKHLTSDVEWTRNEVLRAIASLGPDAVPILRRALLDEKLRKGASEAIPLMKEEAAPLVPDLLKVRYSFPVSGTWETYPSPLNDFPAWKALYRLGPYAKEALPVLKKEYEDTKEPNALFLLATIAPGQTESIESLINIMFYGPVTADKQILSFQPELTGLCNSFTASKFGKCKAAAMLVKLAEENTKVKEEILKLLEQEAKTASLDEERKALLFNTLTKMGSSPSFLLPNNEAQNTETEDSLDKIRMAGYNFKLNPSNTVALQTLIHYCSAGSREEKLKACRSLSMTDMELAKIWIPEVIKLSHSSDPTLREWSLYYLGGFAYQENLGFYHEREMRAKMRKSLMRLEEARKERARHNNNQE